MSEEIPGLVEKSSATHGSNAACRCGCIPEGMISLFQMAELRNRNKKIIQNFQLLLDQCTESDPDHGTIVNLCGKGLNQFPIGPLVTLSNTLIVLHLDHNQLTELPKGLLRSCPLIEDLALHNNCLLSLDEDIGCCNRLEHLRLDNNQLKQLPIQLGECVSLISLHLNGNPLISLPDFFHRLQRLHHILMENVPLVTCIPPSIVHCELLEFITFQSDVIIDPPGFVVSKGGESIRDYFKAKER